MRVAQVTFRADPDSEPDGQRFGFKGVNASFVWSPGIVLFGPNDVGKSNILEAIRTVWNGNDPPDTIRRSLFTDDDDELYAEARVVVELDRLDEDTSTDSRTLAQL